jgi:beta-phosphoglucomutase-like phosphatase (HAD superfamily)
MIKLLIFDIDGVLVKSKKLHEVAFMMALKQHGYNITQEFHRQHLDGLPTKAKLDKLNVPEKSRQDIFDLKQKYTFEHAEHHILKNENIKQVFFEYSTKGYKIAVASNAIKDFCSLVVKILEIDSVTNLLMSNEDVSQSKPHPEIYSTIISHFGYSPSETLIFEDSKFGLSAAFASGANVFIVNDPKDITLKNIHKKLAQLNK